MNKSTSNEDLELAISFVKGHLGEEEEKQIIERLEKEESFARLVFEQTLILDEVNKITKENFLKENPKLARYFSNVPILQTVETRKKWNWLIIIGLIVLATGLIYFVNKSKKDDTPSMDIEYAQNADSFNDTEILGSGKLDNQIIKIKRTLDANLNNTDSIELQIIQTSNTSDFYQYDGMRLLIFTRTPEKYSAFNLEISDTTFASEKIQLLKWDGALYYLNNSDIKRPLEIFDPTRFQTE